MQNQELLQLQKNAAEQLTKQLAHTAEDRSLTQVLDALCQDYEVTEKIARGYRELYEKVKDAMMLEGLHMSEAIQKYNTQSIPEGLLSEDFIAKLTEKETAGTVTDWT